MSQTQTICKPLHSCKQYIDLFLTNLYTLNLERLNTNEYLKVLVFYEELIGFLHNNTPLLELNMRSSTIRTA